MNAQTTDQTEQKDFKQFWDLPQDVQDIIRKIKALPFINDIIGGFYQNNTSYIFTFKASKYLNARLSSIKALVPKNFGSLEIDCLFNENEITVTLKKLA